MKSDPKDSTFERFVKLLQSLLQLVVGGQRNLNIVCATLQGIIFEESGVIPAYKNWKKICELGQYDWFESQVVAMLETDAGGRVDVNNWRVQQIISAFPECFSFEETTGPIPMSVLKAEMTRLDALHGDGGYTAAFELGLPVTKFGIDHEYVLKNLDSNLQDLPESISRTAAFGDVVTWKSRKFVVVYAPWGEEIYVTPADFLNLNL